jgi:hypothetical protein
VEEAEGKLEGGKKDEQRRDGCGWLPVGMEERRKEDNGSVLFRSPPPPPPSLLQNYLKMEEDEWVGGHSRRLDSWAKEEGRGRGGDVPNFLPFALKSIGPKWPWPSISE